MPACGRSEPVTTSRGSARRKRSVIGHSPFLVFAPRSWHLGAGAALPNRPSGTPTIRLWPRDATFRGRGGVLIPPINTATVQHLDRGRDGYGLWQRLAEDEPRRSSLAILQVPQISKLDRRGDPACGGALVEPERMGRPAGGSACQMSVGEEAFALPATVSRTTGATVASMPSAITSSTSVAHHGVVLERGEDPALPCHARGSPGAGSPARGSMQAAVRNRVAAAPPPAVSARRALRHPG